MDSQQQPEQPSPKPRAKRSTASTSTSKTPEPTDVIQQTVTDEGQTITVYPALGIKVIDN